MRILNSAPPGAPPLSPANPAVVNANVSTAQVFPAPSNTAVAAILQGLGTSRLDGRQFIVRASGSVISNGNYNVTVTLYSGTSLTAASNTILKESTARNVNAATAGWFLEGRFSVDSKSGILAGTVALCINNLYDAHAVVTNTISSINVVTEPPFNMVVGMTFSSADAANFGYMNEFVLGR